MSLAALGGSTGLLLAAIGVRLLRISLPTTIAQIGIISMDRRVLVFALIITCLTAVLFGLAPAFRASKPDVNDALKEAAPARPASTFIADLTARSWLWSLRLHFYC